MTEQEKVRILYPEHVAGPQAEAYGSSLGSGPPPSDTAMNERVARLEGGLVGIGRVQSAFFPVIALMVAVMIGGFTVLGVNTSWRFGRVEQDLEKVSSELDQVHSEVRVIGEAVSGIAQQLDRMAQPTVSAPSTPQAPTPAMPNSAPPSPNP